MGLFNFFKSRTSVPKPNKVFVSKKHLPSLEKAKALRKQFLETVPHQDKRSKQFNLASAMLLSKAYDFSIDSYKFLMTKYPDAKAECQSQIGACYYFKREYKKAIEYYLKARTNGANESMMDYNVWEAYLAIYNANKNSTSMLNYLEYFPEGKYSKKAKKMIVG
ncbi:tol-pal system YbgF family protein [Winogradskyella sp. R77965]|uniref:tol-pal system YbgF family protein n=1 Tax=Winogradskyella sp. R77965 TaxID=3093872 RepID=UPI0037DD9820